MKKFRAPSMECGDHADLPRPILLNRRIYLELPKTRPIGGSEQRDGGHQNGEHYKGMGSVYPRVPLAIHNVVPTGRAVGAQERHRQGGEHCKVLESALLLDVRK
jgi:hypothetical protein